MKNHYVYEITYNTGKKYIGVRSCKCNIEEDVYMGSPFHLPKEAVIGCKEILSIHETREVNNSIRNYVTNIDIFPVSSASIMRYLRDDKVPQKILELGWDFGFING